MDTYLDINKDFFETEPKGTEYIISNPPYSLNFVKKF